MILGKYPKHEVELDLELGHPVLPRKSEPCNTVCARSASDSLRDSHIVELELASKDLELGLALEPRTLIFLRFFKLCHQKCLFRLGLEG